MTFLTKDEAKQLSALVLAVVLAVLVTGTGRWGNPVAGGEDVGAVATSLFQTHVLAFETLGIVLLVALVGALVLAMRGEGE